MALRRGLEPPRLVVLAPSVQLERSALGFGRKSILLHWIELPKWQLVQGGGRQGPPL